MKRGKEKRLVGSDLIDFWVFVSSFVHENEIGTMVSLPKGVPWQQNEIESDPHGANLSLDSATTTVCSLNAAQRNPGIGFMVERFPPYSAALHTGYV